jgi:hypothetical protein
MKKFVPTTTQIDATQALFIINQGEPTRPAITRGGNSSRSGLTHWPKWVEQGAVMGFRTDALPKGEIHGDFVVFEGHGTAPENPQPISADEWNDSIQDWTEFREGMIPTKPEFSWTGELARKATRSYLNGAVLTDGEANALSRYPGAYMEIHDADQDGDILEVIRGDGHTAYRIIWKDGDPSNFKCWSDGETTRWAEMGITYIIENGRVRAYKGNWMSSKTCDIWDMWYEITEGPWETTSLDYLDYIEVDEVETI